MFAKQLFLGIAALAVAVVAQAKSDNPLHPNFYWDKYSAAKVVTNGAKQYVDNRNPRHPSYAHVKVDWQPTVAVGGIAYVDNRNPLHPRFIR
jgi:hypothetical protein